MFLRPVDLPVLGVDGDADTPSGLVAAVASPRPASTSVSICDPSRFERMTRIPSRSHQYSLRGFRPLTALYNSARTFCFDFVAAILLGDEYGLGSKLRLGLSIEFHCSTPKFV
jgi:hypothetical protein